MKNSTRVSELVRYPMFILTITRCMFMVQNCKAIWQTVQRSKYKKTCVVSVFILAVIIQVASFVKTVAFVIHVMSNFHNIISFFIQAHLYCLHGAIIYLSESLMCHWYISPLMDSLHEYGEQFGFCQGLQSLKKKSFIATLSLSLGFSLTPIISCVLTLGEGHTYLIYPFEPSSMMLIYLTIFVDWVVLLPIVVVLVLYTVLLEIVVREFYDTSDQMKTVMKQVTEMKLLEQEFAIVRSRHESLCQIVNKLSKLLRLNACVGLLFSLVILFFALYALGSEELSGTYITLEIGYLMWNVLPVMTICVVWGRLPSAANSILDFISMVPKEGVPQDLLLQMQLFVSYCSSRRVGIDVFGLFTLDSTTILMVLGTIVTYGIVVIQFQQDTDKLTNKRMPNNSFIY